MRAMIIDIHTHITFPGFPQFRRALGRAPFTAGMLLKRMDMEGIGRSVLLPLANPENADYFAVAGNRECLRAARRHPDRLIPFCNIDPRMMLNHADADLSKLIRTYRDLGCRGIGEVCANLSVTDPRCLNLYRHAGETGMPLLFHFASRQGKLYGVYDDLHFPGLEQALAMFPETVFIGHGPSFWSEISGDVDGVKREGYPGGPVTREGRLWHLLAAYPNLYGDLSAGSGHNAVSRDPDAGHRFLQRFHRQLFFGTDRFTGMQAPFPPVLTFLRAARRNGNITRRAYENIMHRNFDRVFGVDAKLVEHAAD